ncbi:hypothetical protein LIA77_11924 [Sarocladium implicatum]|nr:hypothetical protein LIA77_11924 [Sarocladium implicatum]
MSHNLPVSISSPQGNRRRTRKGKDTMSHRKVDTSTLRHCEHCDNCYTESMHTASLSVCRLRRIPQCPLKKVFYVALAGQNIPQRLTRPLQSSGERERDWAGRIHDLAERMARDHDHREAVSSYFNSRSLVLCDVDLSLSHSLSLSLFVTLSGPRRRAVLTECTAPYRLEPPPSSPFPSQ